MREIAAKFEKESSGFVIWRGRMKEDKHMKKKLSAAVLAGVMVFSMAGCSGGNGASGAAGDTDINAEDTGPDEEETEIQVFIAASLNTVMTDLAEKYNEDHPNVKITYNADSSGTLLTQIQEGYECDIFFSAAQKQMDDLEADGLMVEGTRANVVNNQVVVVTLKDSGTAVTGSCQSGYAAKDRRCGGDYNRGSIRGSRRR